MKRNIKQALALALILALTSFCMTEGFAQGVVSRPTKKTQKTVKTTGQKNPNRKKSSSESKKQTNIQVQDTKPSAPSQPEPEKTNQETIQSQPENKLTSGHFINGHEWVDLGLPSGLKWATCNIGASTPEEYGKYYAWGEIDTKYSYTPDNSLTFGKNSANLRAEGIINNKGQLNKSYDVASVKWGSSWRMPTKEEFEELINKCKWEWIKKNRTEGYKVTGPNNNSIFLPAASYRRYKSLGFDRGDGCFWSSSTNGGTDSANGLTFFYNKDFSHCSISHRFEGYSVRPVSE